MSEKLKPQKTRAKAKKMQPASSETGAVLEAFQELGISSDVVFDTLNDGIYFLDDKGYFAYVNKVIEKRSGIPFDKFVLLHFLDIVSPKDHKRVKKNFEKVMRGEEVPPYELEYAKSDGTPLVVEVNTKPIFKGNKVVALLGISRDVSLRRQAEELLRESEARLRTAMESMPFDLFILDEGGRYIMQNATCRERWGDILGKRPEDLDVSQETLSLWQKNNKRAFAGEIVREEVSFRAGGKKGYYYNVVSPIRAEGEIRGILGINVDVTDRKRAEQALRKARDELEKRVDERTVELSNANKDLRDEIVERARAEEALKEREKALEMKTNELEEVNSALRVLLRRRDRDKTELEEKVLSNVQELVQPYVEKLRKSPLDVNQMTYVKILESNLQDIVSPFVHQLSSKYSILTPTEIQIAQLIREGKTTKEIAELMGSSKRTVESHRENIRIKLGLKHQKVNLRSFLSSM